MAAAETMMQQNDFYNASLNFENVLKADSSNVDVQYKLAECYRKINNNKVAEILYQSVFNTDKDKKYPYEDCTSCLRKA